MFNPRQGHHSFSAWPGAAANVIGRRTGFSGFDLKDGDMAKGKFERTKPHVNVGTIGHVDHGK
ncbi:MAG TPA: hypothetical protein PKW99_08820, partial [Thauera sp.]|nr:hypothetical protein [Thauera sp.]